MRVSPCLRKKCVCRAVALPQHGLLLTTFGDWTIRTNLRESSNIHFGRIHCHLHRSSQSPSPSTHPALRPLSVCFTKAIKSSLCTHILLGVVPSSGVWSTYQGPRPSRKPTPCLQKLYVVNISSARHRTSCPLPTARVCNSLSVSADVKPPDLFHLHT